MVRVSYIGIVFGIGLEEFAVKEVKQKCPNAIIQSAEVGHGVIIFEVEEGSFDFFDVKCFSGLGVFVGEDTIAPQFIHTEQRRAKPCDDIDALPFKQFGMMAKWDDAVKALRRVVPLPPSPTFRVSCRRIGFHKFTSMDASASFGAAIFDLSEDSTSPFSGWKVNLKYFDVEFIMCIVREKCYFGLSLHRPKPWELEVAESAKGERGSQSESGLKGEGEVDKSEKQKEGKEDKPLNALTTFSNHPFDQRNRLCSSRPTALRPSLSYLLLLACNIQAGDVVVDPMAGVNTIPLEACLSFSHPIIAFGGDFTQACCAEGETNIRYARSRRTHERRSLKSQWDTIYTEKRREARERIERGEKEKKRKRGREDIGEGGEVYIETPIQPHLSEVEREEDKKEGKKDIHLPLDGLQWDARAIPFRSNSVDVMVSDLPFGMRVGNSRINQRIYSKAFSEMHRVLRKGGRAVLLTLERNLVRRILEEMPTLQLDKEWPVDVGGLDVSLYRLIKA